MLAEPIAHCRRLRNSIRTVDSAQRLLEEKGLISKASGKAKGAINSYRAPGVLTSKGTEEPAQDVRIPLRSSCAQTDTIEPIQERIHRPRKRATLGVWTNPASRNLGEVSAQGRQGRSSPGIRQGAQEGGPRNPDRRPFGSTAGDGGERRSLPPARGNVAQRRKVDRRSRNNPPPAGAARTARARPTHSQTSRQGGKPRAPRKGQHQKQPAKGLGKAGTLIRSHPRCSSTRQRDRIPT